MTTPQSGREAFEAWAEREFGKVPGSLPATERFASYWKCWQAALIHALTLDDGALDEIERLQAILVQQEHAFPARFFASGPQGCAWFDDLSLASAMLAAFDKDDDWTVTDTQDTPAPKQQAVDKETLVAFERVFWKAVELSGSRDFDHDVCKEVRDFRSLLATLSDKTETTP